MVLQYIFYGEKQAIQQKTISFIWIKGKLHI